MDVYLVNGSTDYADAVELAFSAGTAPESAEVWRSHTEQAAPQAAVCEAAGTGIRVPVDVPSMEAVLLRMPALKAERKAVSSLAGPEENQGDFYKSEVSHC